MPTGTQLSVLVQNLKTVLEQTTSSSIGSDDMPALKYALKQTQNFLWTKYNWPHLRLISSITLAAGSRYYDVPANTNFDRLVEAATNFTGRPFPVDRGIGFEHYAAFNSESDERSDPVRRYDLVRVSATATQVEVWPIPSTSGSKVFFWSLRNLRALAADTDVCDLDDDLIVLGAARRRLLNNKSPSAAQVNADFKELRANLLTNAQGDSAAMAPSGSRSGRSGYDHPVVVVAR